jgi:dethiobiotin synthetase
VDPHGHLQWNDAQLLSQACGSAFPIDFICPQRFRAAVAPNVAARLEDAHVDDQKLSAGLCIWDGHADVLLIEGAGGVYSPLSDSRCLLDLAAEADGPVLVIAANRLGVINHTRLTVDAIQSKGLKVAAIVLNDTKPAALESGIQSGIRSDKTTQMHANQLRYWIPGVPLLHSAWAGSDLAVFDSHPDSPGEQTVSEDFLLALFA